MLLYIDATAGGLLIQIVLGGVAGSLAVGKLLLWRVMPFRSRGDGAGSDAPIHVEAEHDDAGTD